MNPAPALHIFFHSGSNNPRGFNQLTFQKKLLDGSFGPQPSVTEEVSTGLYEIKGLAAGRYALSGTSGGVSKAPSEIDLNTDGQSLDLSASSPTGSLKALVRIAGAKLPEQLFVVLRNGKGRQVAQSEVDQHGVADFVNLAPDQYDVVAGSPTRQYSVSAIAVADHTSSGHTLNVPAGTALTASLTLVGSTVRVEGIAQQAGKPFHGAMIVLVPGNPDANLELFRRDQSDLDGSFVLQQVIPGTYTIVAIEDGWDLDWAKPHVLAVYRRRGQKIVVGEDKGTVHLPSPVEVQPKL